MPFCAPLIALLLARGEDLRAVAQRLETDEARAALAKDLAYAERIYAPDFVSIGIKGQRNGRAAVLAARKGLFEVYDMRSNVRKVVRVVPNREGMLVTIDSRSRGALRAPGTKRTHDFEIVGRSDEAWARTKEGWRLRSTRVRTLSTRLDGKPLD